MENGALSIAASFLDEAEEQDAEALAVALWSHMVRITQQVAPRAHGGSRPGKSANKHRPYEAAHNHYMARYFWPADVRRPGSQEFGPRETEETFERRFRMPRLVFNRVFLGVVAESEYIRKGLRMDAVGRRGISPLLKTITAMRQIAYAIPSDFCGDLFDVSESTAAECMSKFCEAVVCHFSAEYLRSPTAEDIARVEGQFRAAGFPGCIGCVDCAGWSWKNAPKAMQGSLIGKDGAPCLRMEVVCDLSLWIWHFQFGFPGVMNDLNILQVSKHFTDFVCGTFPPVAPTYKICGETFQNFYYLSDGIYPRWRIFIRTISDPQTRKQMTFSSAQEGARKCVERVFGVLFRQFKILFVGSELWSPVKMQVIAKACVILHNMVVEKRCDQYTSDGVGGASASGTASSEPSDLDIVQASADEVELRLNQIRAAGKDVKSLTENNRLLAALVDHIWICRGKTH